MNENEQILPDEPTIDDIQNAYPKRSRGHCYFFMERKKWPLTPADEAYAVAVADAERMANETVFIAPPPPPMPEGVIKRVKVWKLVFEAVKGVDGSYTPSLTPFWAEFTVVQTGKIVTQTDAHPMIVCANVNCGKTFERGRFDQVCCSDRCTTAKWKRENRHKRSRKGQGVGLSSGGLSKWKQDELNKLSE